MKSMLPGVFREQVYPTRYALKDIGYALDLARETGVEARGAELAEALLRETEARGFGENYYPALINIVDEKLSGDAASED